MTTTHPAGNLVHGRLGTRDGLGSVTLRVRCDAAVTDVWSALTEPRRLPLWLGEVDGDLRRGGEFRARFTASGWEGTGRVDVCDPPQRLVVSTTSAEEPGSTIEVSLTPDGAHTLLVVEDRGLPLEQLAAYGAGDQIHVEDLVAHLAGGTSCDARTRWAELHPGYLRLAAALPGGAPD